MARWRSVVEGWLTQWALQNYALRAISTNKNSPYFHVLCATRQHKSTMNNRGDRPPHLQYTKSNQTTTQPSRQHTMQLLLPPPSAAAAAFILPALIATRTHQPRSTVVIVDNSWLSPIQRCHKQSSHRPTTSTRNAAAALPFVGCGCCLTSHIIKPMPGWYSNSSYKLQRSIINNNIMDHLNWPM
jgi:hypothetical protein